MAPEGARRQDGEWWASTPFMSSQDSFVKHHLDLTVLTHTYTMKWAIIMVVIIIIICCCWLYSCDVVFVLLLPVLFTYL